MQAFQPLYQKLNPAQKKAVDTIEGPVMVIAGPGTGKTQILTLRIANILQKTDTPAHAILALTFTEAGVFAMRKRLVDMIGSQGYQVGIFTFHSFCNDLIRNYPDAFPRIIGSQAITDVEKLEVLQDVILHTDLKRLRPFGDPGYYLKPLMSAISELKRENVLPKEAYERTKKQRESYEQIDDLVHEKGAHAGKVKGKYKDLEKQIEKNEELVKVYERYEEVLRERKLYDYEDMIVETVSALESNEDFLRSVQEEYLYLLADEHQDANNSQNKLLELLASFHEYPNLFLVGDAKQAIYRFQGASLENFLYFKERFPEAELVQLEDNYRSRQTILDSSYSLIAAGDLSEHELQSPLKAHLEESGDKVSVGAFSEPEYEYTYIARSVRDLLDQGVPAEEIAVLYRNNADAAGLLPSLERQGIQYVIESDANILHDESVQGFITLLRAVAKYGNEEVLSHALFKDFLQVSPLDTYKLLRSRRTLKTTLYELLSSKKLLESAGVEAVEHLYALGEKLEKWNVLAHNRSLLEVLDTIAHESGFISQVLILPDSRERLETFRALIRDAGGVVAIHREYDLARYLDYLALLEQYNVSIKSYGAKAKSGSVRLMTAHKSKGLEFDYVFIMGAYDGHWGNKRKVSHFDLLQELQTGDEEEVDSLSDERRLFYVALTRARHGVTITYATQNISGRPQLPCQFIDEIDERYLEVITAEAFEGGVAPQTFFAERAPHTISATDQQYLQESFLEQGLSVTALNNYLKSPWEYFFNNLLRIPKAPNKHMLFGNAVHGALKDFFEHIKQGGVIDEEYLLTQFGHHLDAQSLSLHDYTESKKKGEEHLKLYYAARQDSFHEVFATEFSITTQFDAGEFVIPLRGILDKVEIVSDGVVRVTDYKTGKPKSRNHIEGKTKSDGAGDYKRQLVFYKLLLSLYEDGKYTMEAGAIDFVEPDTKGSIHAPEVFHISDDEVEELKEELRQVAGEIHALTFWGGDCDDKKTSYCPLVAALQKGA